MVCGDQDTRVGVYVIEQMPPLKIQAPPEEKAPEPEASERV
jgi:hypothetical protein